jgi:CBS domain-containing protein
MAKDRTGRPAGRDEPAPRRNKELVMFNTVAELLRHKGTAVHTISPSASALDAAREMNARRIGSLVVVDGGEVVGIVTERDLLTRVLAQERSAGVTPVAEIMTTSVLTCTPETPIDEVRLLMRSRRIRHVPVIDGRRLAGMVSIGDLNFAETQTLSETIKYLEAYISSG